MQFFAPKLTLFLWSALLIVGAMGRAVECTWEIRLEEPITHQADFSLATYKRSVEFLLRAYENRSGKAIVPKGKSIVALKIYTGAGVGLCTPHALTQAVIAALELRGFKEIWIVDQFTHQLRSCGYLPPLTEPQTGLYLGKYKVCALDSAQYWDANWFYDNALPSLEPSAVFSWGHGFSRGAQDRKSFIPTPLLESDVDYWINLPVGAELPVLGVAGALANASLWAISNHQRFVCSGASAPIAAAEICAIPELREPWLFTLMSLETYQVAAGPMFNACYTRSEPALWLSSSPVMLDYALLQKINHWRIAFKFPPYDPIPNILSYAASLNLGRFEGQDLLWIKLE